LTRSHLFALVLGAAALHAQAADTQAPPTKRLPVVDHYGDLTVTDPYRWLENGSDPKVHQWSLAQDNAPARTSTSCPPASRYSPA